MSVGLTAVLVASPCGPIPTDRPVVIGYPEYALPSVEWPQSPGQADRLEGTRDRESGTGA